MTALSTFEAALDTFVAAAATYAGTTPDDLEVTSAGYTARVDADELVCVNSDVVDTPANIVGDFVTKLEAYLATLLDPSEQLFVGSWQLLTPGGQLLQMQYGG